MTITNCPRCGAMNATTTCTKCGWSQFTKSTVSTGVLLDDYKRLLLENRNLKERVAELEALVERLIEAGDRLSDSLCTYPEEEKTIEVMNWKAVVDKANKERDE